MSTWPTSLSFVPYFARYPYETFIAPRATHNSIADLSAAELTDFTAVLQETLAETTFKTGDTILDVILDVARHKELLCEEDIVSEQQ